jgi:hypothetical protein
MFTSDEDNDGCSGSRVDAPQKPNCRSLVQGLERQGIQRHLPSRSSVPPELRDGNTHTCGTKRHEFSRRLPALPRSARLVPGRRRRARVWHALVRF